MRRAPNEPRDAAGQPQPTEVYDRVPTAYRRKISVITVAERRRRWLPAQARADDSGDIGAFLLGDGSNTGQRAVSALGKRGVADDENFGMPGYAQIGSHRYSAVASR